MYRPYSNSENLSTLDAFFLKKRQCYSATSDFKNAAAAGKDDNFLTRSAMLFSESAFQKEWEDEDDAHWRSFLNE